MDFLTKVLDHYDDKGKMFAEAIGSQEPPEIVKTAADLTSVPRRYEKDFALVVNTDKGRVYRFPIVDAGNTAMSTLYFDKTAGLLPADLRKEVAAKLQDACAAFGLPTDDGLAKTASSEIEEQVDLSVEMLFGNDKTVSNDVVLDTFNRCSPLGKRKVAKMMAKTAGIESVPEDLRQYANDAKTIDFLASIEMRKRLTIDADALGSLDAIFFKRASVDETIEALFEWDKANELVHMYGTSLPDPVVSVVGSMLEKTASVEEFDSNALSSWLENGGVERLTDAFGDDFSNQFKADPVTVLKSLPVTHKNAITRMIDGQ